MANTFYIIHNLELRYSSDITFEERQYKDTVSTWFSFNPVKKVGKGYEYTADYNTYDLYKPTSHAMKRSISMSIYTYGESRSIKIKGWTFPCSYGGELYSSASGKTSFLSIRFNCTAPDGTKVRVDYKDDFGGSYFDLFAYIIKKLTSMSGNYPSYVNNKLWDHFHPYYEG